MLEVFAGAALIFVLRICDVSIGTVRTIYMIRGKRFYAAGLGFIESMIFIYAVTTVLANGTSDHARMVGYALGYATGTALGVTLEGLIASGQVMIRAITERGHAVVEALRLSGFGATLVNGEGRDGPIEIVFCVSSRRVLKRSLGLINRVDSEAFVTIDPVARAIGGYSTRAGFWATLLKK